MNRIRKMFEGTSRFIKEVRIEMQKVTWPSRIEVISSTVVVIFATFLLSVFIWGQDWIFSRIMQIILFGVKG